MDEDAPRCRPCGFGVDEEGRWIPPPRVPPRRWVKPEEQTESENALQELLGLVESDLVGIPVTTAAADAPCDHQFRMVALMRMTALCGAIVALNDKREDEGVPILVRTALDVFLTDALVWAQGINGFDRLLRDSWLREKRLRERRQAAPIAWPPPDIPQGCRTDEPSGRKDPKGHNDFLSTREIEQALRTHPSIRSDPVLARAVELSAEMFEWTSQLAIHGTIRAIGGHMFRARAGSRYEFWVADTPPGERLNEDALVFTGSNGHIPDPTPYIQICRQILWWVALWAAELLPNPAFIEKLKTLGEPHLSAEPDGI